MTTGRINQVAVRRAAAESAEANRRRRTTDYDPAEWRDFHRVARRRNDVATLAEPAGVVILLLTLVPQQRYRFTYRTPKHRDATGRCRRRAGNPSVRTYVRMIPGGTAIFHSRSDDPLRDPNLQDCRVLNIATPTCDSYISGRESRPRETDH